MSKIIYQGQDLTTCHDSYLRTLLNPNPRRVSNSRTLDGFEFTGAISGSLSKLPDRMKTLSDSILSAHGDGELEAEIGNTGFYCDSWSLVVRLVRPKFETEEEAKTRVSLATQALAARAKTAAKKKQLAEVKKIERLKASLSKLTEAERAELLKG